MTRGELQVLAAAGFAVVAVALAWRLRLGLARELAVAAVRAAVQLAAVGAIIAAVFGAPALAFVFVGAMVLTAAATSGARLRGVPRARGARGRGDRPARPLRRRRAARRRGIRGHAAVPASRPRRSSSGAR